MGEGRDNPALRRDTICKLVCLEEGPCKGTAATRRSSVNSELSLSG